jgi:3-isopropylmalate/(R)-2-methylmalate dehydratase small subunit
MNDFGGKVLFLDRSNINTDEIIPAKYLTEIKKDALKPHLLEDLNMEDFDPRSSLVENAGVIVTRENFGCGSSREHAVWALEVNRFRLIIAQSFARIFRQNMFNCGLMAIELPNDTITTIFNYQGKNNIYCSVDIEKKQLQFNDADTPLLSVDFSIDSFYEELIKAGGWVEYADKKY